MSTTWSLSTAQRADTVQRVATNIFTLGFTKGLPISDDDAQAAAVAIEKKAYTAAEVAARTTTGDRPFDETTKAYARKLGELVIEVINAGGKYQQETVAAAGAGQSLDLTGSRDFLTKESTEEVLAPLLAEGSQITKIRFSTKSFGRDAAGVAARAIQNVSSSLTDADISDVIAGRPEDEALDALRVLSAALSSCKLKRVNLSDNALGEKGVRACADVLTTQAALEGLSLQNVGCSINACKAVAELLTASQDLKQLHLFNNMSDNAGAQHIASILARAPLMADFRMASSRVGPAGGIALAQGLCAGANLVRLDISDNPMTGKVAAALATLVSRQPHLKALNLNDTSLGNDGAALVAVAVAQGVPQLEELELALNEITPSGARALALAIANKPKLWKLNVRENELEDKGAVILAKGVEKASSLRVIDACGNQLKRMGAVALARAASTACAGLELLAMDENMISEEGIDEVQQVMEAAGKSKALGSLDENMEEDDEEEDGKEGEEEEDALTAMMAKAGLK